MLVLQVDTVIDNDSNRAGPKLLTFMLVPPRRVVDEPCFGAGELRSVEKRIFGMQQLLALMSIASILLGCAVNELCAGSDYRETEPDPEELMRLADPLRPPRNCSQGSRLVLPIKLVQSGLTVCLLVAIYMRFRLQVHFRGILRRLRDRQVQRPAARYISQLEASP